MATQDDFIRTALRVPPDLHARIHEAASAANRTFNAEIVARLQKSFEVPAATEVPWDLRVEQRALEARIDTLRAHLMTLRMYADVLDTKSRNAVAHGAPETEVRAFRVELSEITRDELRIQDQLRDLVAQSNALDRQYADASRPILERMDVTVEKQLQADYRQLHAAELKLGIPEEARTVKVIVPATPEPEFIVRGDLDPNVHVDLSNPSRERPKTQWFDRGFNYSIGNVSRTSQPGRLVEVARLTIPSGVAKPGDEKLIYDQIVAVEKLHGHDCTVWLDIQGKRIPKSVHRAIELLGGFGVGLVLTLEGQSTLSNPDNFSSELMTAIKHAMRSGLVWCPIAQKLMHAPHGVV